MIIIAKVLDVGYEHVFILPEGEKVGIRRFVVDDI